ERMAGYMSDPETPERIARCFGPLGFDLPRRMVTKSMYEAERTTATIAWPLRNVWAMTSVENQEYAERRIPELLKVPAHIRGLSVEPLLEPVDLRLEEGWQPRGKGTEWFRRADGIHWVIGGGESGPRARSCHLKWIRDLVRQCREAGVACFV